MRIFVYEFATGGGGWGSPDTVCETLLREGCAMSQALTMDLLRIPGIQVSTTRDSRVPPCHPPGCVVNVVASAKDESSALQRLAAQCDAAILIAPEIADELLSRTALVASIGCRLLSPGPDLVRMAGDKSQTARRLSQHGVPVPAGVEWNPGDAPSQIAPPVVVKPNDGCGSQGVRRIDNQAALSEILRGSSVPLRIEAFVPGLAASVAMLCGPEERLPLPACEQRLSLDGQFQYLGGRTPLPARYDARARRLALSALDAFPSVSGYVGVDLVLGEADDGRGDAVIEINPRLTTSYIGLRFSCRENLAEGMLNIAFGRPATLSFDPRPLEFDADGAVRGEPVERRDFSLPGELDQ